MGAPRRPYFFTSGVADCGGAGGFTVLTQNSSPVCGSRFTTPLPSLSTSKPLALQSSRASFRMLSTGAFKAVDLSMASARARRNLLMMAGSSAFGEALREDAAVVEQPVRMAARVRALIVAGMFLVFIELKENFRERR